MKSDYLLVNALTTHYIRLSKQEWFNILTQALRNGWKPLGTNLVSPDISLPNNANTPPLSGSANNDAAVYWRGSYTKKERQTVSKIDAIALYNALYRANIRKEILAFVERGAFYISATTSSQLKVYTNHNEFPNQMGKAPKLKSLRRDLRGYRTGRTRSVLLPSNTGS